MRTGDYKNGLLYLNKALKIRLQVLNKEHPELAVSYHNLGSLYFYKKDYKKSLQYFKQAIQIREKVLDPHHPFLGSSLKGLAEVYLNMGNQEEAVKHYLKTIDTFGDLSENDQGSLGPVYSELAVIYLRMGKPEEALHYNLKSLPLIDKTYDRLSIDWALSRHNLAATLCTLKRFKEAKPYIEEALAVYQQILPPQHDYYIRARNWKAQIENGLKG